VARVTLALLWRERGRDLDLVAAVLPEGDAALHRLDVLVTEDLLEGVGRPRRAIARGAVEDHAAGLVRSGALDPRLEVAAGDVNGAGEVRLVPLMLLTDVDDHGAVAGSVLDQVVDLPRVHFRDALLDLPDYVWGVRHYFIKCSDGVGAPKASPKSYRGALSDAPAKTQTSVLWWKLGRSFVRELSSSALPADMGCGPHSSQAYP
jgi:hypothetical protein